jgi:excisionase family DNA binding protein
MIEMNEDKKSFDNNSVLSVKTLSKYLSISESTIRKLIRSKEIPYLKIEGQYRFFLPKIHEWLSCKTIPAVESDAISKQALEISQKIWDETIGVK